jgi:hypothetical protein
MQMESRVAFNPRLYPGLFVSAIVVYDRVNVEFRKCLGIDSLEEPNELLMPMSRHAVPNDPSIQHAQRSKQRRRTVSLMVMRLPGGHSRSLVQQRLGSVERLNLAFLVHV